MFIGTAFHVLDDKGRLAIPSRFRPDLAPGLVITRGTEPCLHIYTLDAWEKIKERLENLSMFDSNARMMRRHMFGWAEDMQLDKQGRILISQELRTYAGLSANVAVVGNNTFIEVWDEERWRQEDAEFNKHVAEIASHLAGK